MIETIGYTQTGRSELDFYLTPSEEVFNIFKYEKLTGNTTLDNCCGIGNIGKPIKELYPNMTIIETDLAERGYGIGGLDFLHKDYPYINNIDNIVINPPFNIINEFVKKSLSIANKKLIVFARLQFLETKGRYEELHKDNPPSRVYVYVDRINCPRPDETEKKSSSMCYAWFVYDKEHPSTDTKLFWIRKNTPAKNKK